MFSGFLAFRKVGEGYSSLGRTHSLVEGVLKEATRVGSRKEIEYHWWPWDLSGLPAEWG